MIRYRVDMHGSPDVMSNHALVSNNKEDIINYVRHTDGWCALYATVYDIQGRETMVWLAGPPSRDVLAYFGVDDDDYSVSC